MSMHTLTILQLTGIVIAYGLLMFVAPALALWKHLKGMRVTAKLLFCFITSNAYVVVLVFLLQLLHISNRLTMIIGIILPLLMFWKRDHSYSLKAKVAQLLEQFRRLASGTYGAKSFWSWFFGSIGHAIRKSIFDRIIRVVRRNKVESIYAAILFLVAAVVYGSRALVIYGYTSSDIAGHTRIVNAMADGHPFAEGIPHGYHCIIYALHAIFGIRIYTLMRLMFFVTALALTFVTYAFVRLLVQNRFVYYGFLIAMLVETRLGFTSYARYYASLPEVYGMLFILPIIYYALIFMKMHSSRKWIVNPLYGLGMGALLFLTATPNLKTSLVQGFTVKGLNSMGLYAAYFLPVLLSYLMDLLVTLLGLIPGISRAAWVLPLALSVLIAGNQIATGSVRTLTRPIVASFEPNGSIVCLTNINRSGKKNQWTIVAADDECSMVQGKGSALPSLEFLLSMRSYSSYSKMYIPTEDVYFFIEKKPLTINDDLTPQPLMEQVTEEDAVQKLSAHVGAEIYQGSERRIIMAKMYYWAKAFQEKFPESCTVYYENDSFICYRVHQNTYRLYNFAIDYKYNH